MAAGLGGEMIEVSKLFVVIVDLDSGTVVDTNVVFIPEDVWQQVGDDFAEGQMSDQDVIDFASSNGIRPLVD